MRKFKMGESVKTSIKTNLEGFGEADKEVTATIIAISPDRKYAKLRLDNNTELLTETRFLK